MKQLLLDIQPPSSPTLDNFIVGSNAETLHSLKMAIDGANEARFIYLWGAPGSGKSHLLQACNDLAHERNLSLSVVDDVHTLDEDAQIELFNYFNQLRTAGGILITSGSAAPTQMGLRDDLATRLAWGLVYQLHPLTDEEKVLIKPLCLITAKPAMYVANVKEDGFENNPHLGDSMR